MASKRPSVKPIAIAPRKSESRASIEVGKQSVKAALSTGESVEVLLHGATVISWTSSGGKSENLWLSKSAVLDGTAAVRGGIPVVFPIFGPPPKDVEPHSKLSQHGFARSSGWELMSSSSSDSHEPEESVSLVFGLSQAALADEVRKVWPVEFGAIYTVVLGKTSLRTILTIKNTGSSSLRFQSLFHTYFRVPDVSTVRLVGLGSASYTDKLLNHQQATETRHEIDVTGPIDRVYTTTADSSVLSVKDVKTASGLFEIERRNLPNVVVWNPWKEGAAAIGDFAPKGDVPNGYRNMLCVEPGKVSDWTVIEPGEEWEGSQVVKSHL